MVKNIIIILFIIAAPSSQRVHDCPFKLMHVPSPVTDICGHPLDLMHTYPSPRRHAQPLRSALTSLPILRYRPDPMYAYPLECMPTRLNPAQACPFDPSQRIPPHIHQPPAILACVLETPKFKHSTADESCRTHSKR